MTDFIQDGTGSGYRAKVDSENRVAANAISTTAATDAAEKGDLFNINSGLITLTNAARTGVLYIKNNSPSSELVFTRSFYNLSASVGGSGYLLCDVIRNPTQGTLITAGTVNTPINLNFGSNKILDATCVIGTTGSTLTDGTTALSTLSEVAGTRILIGIDSLILLPGSSIAIAITPPAGNTNLVVQVGFNLYRKDLV